MMPTPPVPVLPPLAQLDLKKLNQRFEMAHPKSILAWCLKQLPTGLVQVSTFNVDDLLITDLLYRELQPTPAVPVLFVDTLFQFKETLELVTLTQQVYRHLNLQIYKPSAAEHRKAFQAKFGKTLWNTDRSQFHQLTHHEPRERGLDDLQAMAWLTARRREQADVATDLPIFERDPQQRLVINPLANWTRKETWAYVFEHDVIYHPLHDHGYDVIGDQPLTVRSTRDLEIPYHP